MPHPVLSVAQMRQWEKATWATGIRESDVIRRAGQAVARQAEAMTRPGDFILFLAGRGHNGDDAALACESLAHRQGEVLRVTDPDAAAAALPSFLDRQPALIVDGLFGIGLNRPLAPAWTALINRINAAGRPVLAVDVPSGLDAEAGRPMDTAVRAAVTLTLGAPKTGLLTAEAGPFVGRLQVAADIGLIPCPFQGELNVLDPRDFQRFPPPRPLTGHKGSFGHLAILAGSRGYHGAAVLAARAAQRAQPGLITLLVPEAIYAPVAAQLQAVMVRPYAGVPELPDGVTALVAGPGLADPGLSEHVRGFVQRQWSEFPAPMLVDASALDWLPASPAPAPGIRVITPHPGEAARLLGTTAAAVQAGRLAALRELARRWPPCLVVLKGHHTLVGGATGPVWLNPTGNPHLAQGGSGDVLAGFAGGFLAQPALAAEAPQATAYAVWRHGLAADTLEARTPGFVVEDLIPELACPRTESGAS